MKSTTKQILSLVESENIKNYAILKEKIISYGLGNSEYQEMNAEEAITELEILNNLIENSINDKNNLFENSISFQERATILSIFQNLNSYISNIKNGINQINNFIQHVQQLRSQINKSYLDNKIKGYPNYQEKLNQVSYLKQKYEKLILIIGKAEELKSKSDAILSSIVEKDEQGGGYLDRINDSKIKIDSIEKDINSRYENVKTLNSNIVQYEAETNQYKESILSFFKRIDEYENKIKTGLESINQTSKNAEIEMKSSIEKNNMDKEKIIDENKKLQEEIRKILGKGIGTNLYKSFNEKSYWMLRQTVFWFVLLAISIWFLSDSGKYIFESLKPFFETGQIKDLTLTFYLRLTLIFPAIYAVYFSASEFKSTSKLKEEYDFKSSVAVALHHFKEIVEKSEKEQDKQFLIDSIKSIFESPTEKVFGKKINEKDLNSKAKDIVSDIADITGNIANKILPK